MNVNLTSARNSRRRTGRSLRALAGVALTALLLQSHVPTLVWAFKPTTPEGAGDETHISMTRKAIMKVLEDELDVEQLTPSMLDASKQISDADADVDLSGKFFDSKYHFDDENFRGGQRLLTRVLIPKIKDAAGQHNYDSAREALGQALHAVQDFYAHSNWVDSFSHEPNSSLGVSGSDIENTAGSEDTCRQCVINPLLDCGFDCANNISTTRLTSGYFDLINPWHRPLNKCSHGGFFDITASLWGGINKDTSNCIDSPRGSLASSEGTLHSTAAAAAEKATRQFILNLREPGKVGSENALTDEEFEHLLGVIRRPLVLAFHNHDDTETEAYKEILAAWIESLRNTPAEPSQYVLAPFNQNGAGPLTEARTIDEFLSAVNALSYPTAEDEGAPPFSLTALRNGMSESDSEPVVVLFVEYDPDGNGRDLADAGLLQQTLQLAKEKRATVFCVVDAHDADHPPVLAAYKQLADATGGIYFSSDPPPFEHEDDSLDRDLEFLKSLKEAFTSDTSLPPASANSSPPSLALPPLPLRDGTSAAGTTQSEVLIDSTVSRATFFLRSGSEVTLKRPDGSAVRPTDPNVTYRLIGIETVISLPSPQPGVWTASSAGEDQVSLSVAADSTINHATFNFVQPAGQPPHEGFTPITGHPVAGQTGLVEASLDHKIISAQVELRNASGQVLRTLPLTADMGEDRFSFFGSVVTPGEPFSVFVTGVSLGGDAFARALPGVVNPQTLSLSAPTDFEIQAGRAAEVKVTVRNFGAADAFKLTATDDGGFLQPPGEVAFTLASQESRELTINLRAPNGARRGTSDGLSIRVESAGAGGAENYAFVRGVVVELHNSIRGRVSDGLGVGIQNASVLLSGPAFSESMLTGADGAYEFNTLPLGTSYTVTPSFSDFHFTPAARAVDNLSADATVNFSAAETRLLQFETPPLAVAEGGVNPQVVVTRVGDASGYASVTYATSDVDASAGSDYTASKGVLIFAPGERSKSFSVPIIDDNAAEAPETFRVTLSEPAGTSLGQQREIIITILDNNSTGVNPIDDTAFFVRQHYLDFLNREPDTSGLNFWVNEIESCGANAQCREVRRINVSAAFFLSIEFQQTGYLTYRAYKAAFGNAQGKSVPITREEMLADMQQIGRDVIVGQGDWEARLEVNKLAYFHEFVTRARFADGTATSLTPAQFADALFQNAGVTPTAEEWQTVIDEFGGAAGTADTAARARALRRVAENLALNRREFNRAFVAMQYFGYLKRDPDEVGFNFWLQKLDSFGGNFIRAEMVKAFISSDEYRQRFASK